MIQMALKREEITLYFGIQKLSPKSLEKLLYSRQTCNLLSHHFRERSCE